MESHEKESFSYARVFSGSLLVFGTAVGAGMLGIPLMTAKAGFGPAFLVTGLVWLFMTLTGLLLLEASLQMPQGANIISLSRRFLGTKGVWISAVICLFLYNCLLVAYFAGGAPLLGQVIRLFGITSPPSISLGLFAFLFGGVVLLGPTSIDRVNRFLAMGMLGLYVALVAWGSQKVESKQLTDVKEFSSMMMAVPMLVGAFGYHSVIPSLTTYLHKQKKVLRASILIGTSLAFLFYVVWQWMILGSVSPSVLEETLAKGLPVTYALGGDFLYVLGQGFAFLALTTSFLGISFSLVDFIQDGVQQVGWRMHRLYCALLALLPPLLCVLLNPTIFDRALNIAGGIGVAILNGLFPVLLFLKMRQLLGMPRLSMSKKNLLGFLIFFSLFIFFYEVYHLIVA